ncbi:MAG: hypothetical protein KC441_04345 [Anaerolineales bacterium]|nr:hypothetical protein [Anaerolineales bacterium]
MDEDVVIIALTDGAHIDDVRAAAPGELPLLNEAAAAAGAGEWVPFDSLQGHPEMIYFLSDMVSIGFNGG